MRGYFLLCFCDFWSTIASALYTYVGGPLPPPSPQRHEVGARARVAELLQPLTSGNAVDGRERVGDGIGPQGGFVLCKNGGD